MVIVVTRSSLDFGTSRLARFATCDHTLFTLSFRFAFSILEYMSSGKVLL
jgi:hypothetical protein